MGRKSFGVVCLFGIISASVAVTYPGFSFLTSETQNYPPPQPSSYLPKDVQTRPSSSRPIVRSHRGAPSFYSSAPTVFLNKAPLYYPESSVFSDPLPIVQLPQLPSEFLTLSTRANVNTGAYGGSEREVPKKSSKTSRRSKSRTTTPAPEDEEEDDAQETEGDTEDQGGYPASKSPDTDSDDSAEKSKSKQRQRSRSRPSQKEQEPSDDESSEVAGGYPSSFGVNQGSGSFGSNRTKTRPNRNRNNKPDSDEEEDAGEIEGDDGQEDDEIMMTGDDGEDDGDDNASEVRDDADEEEIAEQPKRGNKSSKSGRKGGKKRGRAGSRSRGKDDDDDSAALNAALSNDGQKIDSFFVPTFGNNVLNTVFPAFSQNALLRSLDSQSDNGYPQSGKDISAITITNEDEDSAKGRKKSRKSKKRTSPRRKNRQGSRGRSGRRGGGKNKQNSVRAQEPSEQLKAPKGSQKGNGTAQQPNQQQQYGAPQGLQQPNQQYGTPGQSFSSPQYGAPQQQFQQPNQQYGNPGQSFSSPQQQYGAPFQSGIVPPQQSGHDGGYRTINNEMRQRTSDPPQQYGSPSFGGTSARFLEPRQLSQASIVGAGNRQFSNSNGQVNQELIRTVQAILEKYPN